MPQNYLHLLYLCSITVTCAAVDYCPTPHLVISHWQLELGCGERIYITKNGQRSGGMAQVVEHKKENGQQYQDIWIKAADMYMGEKEEQERL